MDSHHTPEFLAEDSSSRLLAFVIIFIMLLNTLAILRLTTQRIRKRSFGLDDLFSYVGLVFILAECVLGIVLIPVAGVGRHVAYLEMTHPEKLKMEYILLFPIEILYISAFTFSKLSILFLYLRIFVSKTARIITYLLIAVVVMTWISETLSGIFQCTPVRFFWDKSIKDGHCIDQQAAYQYWSLPNIITDVIMLILPLPMIWKLQLPIAQKLGLTVTLMFGGIGLVASILRFLMFHRTFALADATWVSVELTIWTILEPSMYYFAGVFPTLGPLLTTFFTKISSTVSSSIQRSSSRSKRNSSNYRSDGNAAGINIAGMDKCWKPLGDHILSDDLALVDYSQAVFTANANAKDWGESECRRHGPSIISTNEVTDSRETV